MTSKIKNQGNNISKQKEITVLGQHRLFLIGTQSRITRESAKAQQQWYSYKRKIEIADTIPKRAWQFSHAFLSDITTFPVEWLELRAKRFSVFVALLDDRCCEEVGGRYWWEYEGETRLLLMSLSIRNVIEDLQSLFGLSWQPVRLLDKNQMCTQNRSLLGWKVNAFKDEVEWQPRGLLLADLWSLNLLSSLQPWRPPSMESGYCVSKNLQFKFNLAYHPKPFILSELRCFHIGDVMLLDKTEKVFTNVHLCNRSSAIAFCVNIDFKTMAQIKVIKETSVMTVRQESIQAQVQSENEGDNASMSSRLDNMEIELCVVLGQINIPLNLLLNMQPGYVLELPQRVDQIQAYIKVNDAVIGKGDMLAIDDQVGIRLCEIDFDGVK